MTNYQQHENRRKSLRQSLKALLQCCRRRSAVCSRPIVGSGILRKVDLASTAYLPTISKVSLFPNFGSGDFDIDHYSVHLPCPHKSGGRPTVIGYESPNPSTVSLLPLTRLSQFNLRETLVDTASPSYQIQYEHVPRALVEGASRQASFITYQSTLSVPASKSALKIRKSTASLARHESSLSHLNNHPPGPAASGDVETPFSRPKDPIGSHLEQSPPIRSPPLTMSSPSIKHFSSFCVLDTSVQGYPVTATSEDLRYIFDVGEQFFLHNQECAGTSIDVVSGYDASGNEVTHLALFSPLVSPSSGRSRFMLACLIDVTDFLQDAASLPDLETISEVSLEDEVLQTPRDVTHNIQSTEQHPAYELSAEHLLGGCFLIGKPEERKLNRGKNSWSEQISNDVWLHLAREEKHKPKYQIRGGQSSRSSSSSSSTSSRAKHAEATGSCQCARSSFGASGSTASAGPVSDTVLEEFMSNLQQVYSDFFLLAKSPLDDAIYEICNVSPGMFSSKEYVDGHLSRTPATDIMTLSEKLGYESSFSMMVRWGRKGQKKRLYCIPLFGQSSVTWICVLVDIGVPYLW